MKLKIITAIIIAINVLLLAQEVPLTIIVVIFSSLLASFIVNGTKVRNTIKISLLILSIGLLRYYFKILLSTECAVSFVMILSSSKFWELNEERDHFNMFLILALSVCSVFLLNPTFMIFLYGLVTLLFYFYYIFKIRNYDTAILNKRRMLILVAPSIAVSLLLFYTFPRFTQGFMTSNDMKNLIGGNSKLDFSQLGPLSTSNELAFKVRGLENSNLPFKIIYWRSSVFWNIAGQEWLPVNSNLKLPEALPVIGKFKYEVEVFNQMKEYFPTLDGTSAVTNSTINYHPYGDGTFKVKAISRAPLTFNVSGNYGDRQKFMSDLMTMKGLRIKSKASEKIRTTFFSKATHDESDEVRLKELVQIFKKKEFEYSISPPMYASIEDFLLSGTQGYCSHFAAAFTYLARLYNLPSRMVSGYLGGEYNPYDGSVLVKEKDAHAWSEIYIKSKGWVKIDPTALVAPLRTSMSADEFNLTLNPYIEIYNFKISRELFSFETLNNLYLWTDSLNSIFNTNIFNFDRDKQLATLRSLTPKNFSIGWLFAITLTFSLLIFWSIFYYLGKIRTPAAEKRYNKFINRMASIGLIKERQETISSFRNRCLIYSPEKKNYIDSEVSHYIDSFYK